MVLAFGPADAATYENPAWVDSDGNRYAVASFIAQPSWMEGASSALSRPDWDTDEDEYSINMAGAMRAQAKLFVVAPDEEGVFPDPTATPDRITCMPGDDGLAALAAMGLSRSETPYEAPPAPEPEDSPEE
jgi:hypothetical protein